MSKRLGTKTWNHLFTMPSSKSDSQRALFCASLCSEKVIISGLGSSADELAALNAIKSLGKNIHVLAQSKKGISISVDGQLNFAENLVLNLNESGLGFRLAVAIASLSNTKIICTGEGSLKERSMQDFEQILPQLGVEIKTFNGCLPLEIKGPFKPTDIVLDANKSSQFLSGLLIALNFNLQKEITVSVNKLASKPYVLMTLSCLKAFGITIKVADSKFTLFANQTFHCNEYVIEKDWSAASCWLAAAALGGNIVLQGLNEASDQADKAMLIALTNAGCSIAISNGTIEVKPVKLVPFEFDASNCPDLFPALVLLASKIIGHSKIKGYQRLHSKESDRAKSLQLEFKKLGVEICFDEQYMIVTGVENYSPPFENLDSHNDHRIAMCLALAVSFSKFEYNLIGSESVVKSYPNFWEDYESAPSLI